jgi:hypothetical protein
MGNTAQGRRGSEINQKGSAMAKELAVAMADGRGGKLAYG